MSLPAVELHRFTRGEYQRMGAAGLFPTRVELIEGAIYDMSPQKSAHAVVVSLAEAALRSAYGTGSNVRYIRVQMPLALYRSRSVLRRGDTLTLLAGPMVAIAVADLLP